MNVTFPLVLKFKLLSISSELSVTNANGELLAVVKERVLSLRDEVRVFADLEKRRQTHGIKADRVMDWNAVRHIVRADGSRLGGIRAHGMKTMWAAQYDILDAGGQVVLHLREDKPLLKLVDAFFDLIPIVGDIVGGVVGYFLNPTYTVSDANGNAVFSVIKKRGFFERTFTVEQRAPVPEEWQELAVLALIQMVLRERGRG